MRKYKQRFYSQDSILVKTMIYLKKLRKTEEKGQHKASGISKGIKPEKINPSPISTPKNDNTEEI